MGIQFNVTIKKKTKGKEEKIREKIELK